MHISSATLIYLGFVFGLLVIPRALQRFRLPAPLTCVVLGIVVAKFFPQTAADGVMPVVATLGIASLFLFAGLEVDLDELRTQVPRLTAYLMAGGLILLVGTWVAIRFMHMAWQPAALLSLGLFTPSTGFILDTLPHSGLDEVEQRQVSMNAIAAEIVALLVLFVVSQAGSMKTLAVSSGILVLLIVLTPILFLALGRYVVPHAPGSEFSLLIMVAIICAVVSQGLGVHFLVGAFVAGMVAGLLQDRMQTLASDTNLQAVRLFSSFFVPFYFFREGMEVPGGALVWRAVLYGLALAAVVIPIRVGKDWVEALVFTRRRGRSGIRVAVALVPTLIFTLVIAGMLHAQFHISDELFGGLLAYAAIATILPSFVLPQLVSAAAEDGL
ncbi:MAG: cation:proton antiporter [Edaphobacter sp.]|uniref:cation:proton antiporter n=1 Tax=Edaphobacter sp. TaxID=1934404 RepID=UPI002388EA80|nr:cation:proton antiporter [Edaphobacter sp.]MDE1176596.1 cation:proton antiporter [Edaphobacter sp.]